MTLLQGAIRIRCARRRLPIALGFLDYGRKVGGFGPTLVPSGDIEADMGVIRRFYAGVRGRYESEFAAVEEVPPRDDTAA